MASNDLLERWAETAPHSPAEEFLFDQVTYLDDETQAFGDKARIPLIVVVGV